MNGGPFVPTLTLRYRIGKVTKHTMGKYVAVIERCNPIKKIRLKMEASGELKQRDLAYTFHTQRDIRKAIQMCLWA